MLKTRTVNISIASILLGLLPIIALITHPNVIITNYDHIIKLYGSLMSIMVLCEVLGIIQSYFLEVNTKVVGTTETIVSKYYTVPCLSIIYIIDLIVLYITKPQFVESNFNSVTTAFGSIISFMVIYTIFGGNYKPLISKTKNNA